MPYRSLNPIRRAVGKSAFNFNYCGHKDYAYFAPSLDSMGYPPAGSVVRKAAIPQSSRLVGTIGAVAKGARSCVRIVYWWSRLRRKRSVFLWKLDHAKVVEFGHAWEPSRRKRVRSRNSRNVVVDLNFAFLNKRALEALRLEKNQEPPFICSLALLRFSDLLATVVQGTAVALSDLNKCMSDDPIGVTIANLLKYRAVSIYMSKFRELALCLFWENRGYQNRIADDFPERTYFFVVGDEGKLGPVFLNHRDHRFKCRAFFSSRRMFKLVGNRFTPDRSHPETLVDLSLTSGPLASLIKPSSPVDNSSRKAVRFCFLQSHADFDSSRLSRLATIGPELVVLVHPEFSDLAEGLIRFRSDVHYFTSTTVFLFSDVTTSAYQCWMAGYEIAHVDLGGGNNFLADLGVVQYTISDLREACQPGQNKTFSRRPTNSLRVIQGAICVHQDLESMGVL